MTDQELYLMRRAVFDAAGEVYQAQITYTDTVLHHQNADAKMAAAERGLVAVKRYATVLESYLRQISEAKSSSQKHHEMVYTLRLLNLVYDAQNSWSTLLDYASRNTA